MAVKRANTKKEDVETKVVDTEVDTEVEVDTDVEEVVETPEIEIPDEEVENNSDIEVDTKVAEVKEEKKTEDKVKIRMRADHKCCIAMERYDLKEGKTYTVPANVKRILNKAGLLAPL